MTLADLLAGRRPAGVLGLGEDAPGTNELALAAAAAGWRVVVLDGARATSGRAFLALAGEAFALPDWYGANWDALADCLGDLDWLPAQRWLVLWEDADALGVAEPRAVLVALDVFEEACDRWAGLGRAFAVLVRPAPAELERV